MVAQILSIGSKALSYGYRGLKAAPTLLFTNHGSKALVTGINRGLKQSTSSSLGGSLWNAFKRGGRALEGSAKTGGGFWKTTAAGVKALPGSVAGGWKTGMAAAKAAGKVGIWGGIKGALGGVTKALPGIGNIAMAACALPTIVSAFKDKGFFGGVKEIAKEGTKLGAGAVGAAIGSTFGPLGSAVGWIAGSLIGGLFTGKSHAEKKAEAEQKAQLEAYQQQQAAAGQAQYAPNDPYAFMYDYKPQSSNPFHQNPYRFQAVG